LKNVRGCCDDFIPDALGEKKISPTLIIIVEPAASSSKVALDGAGERGAGTMDDDLLAGIHKDVQV